jgi:putative Holliday junction resolvase
MLFCRNRRYLMAIAAIDFGKSRIGVAISDHRGTGAYPLGIVERRSLTADLEQIARMLAARDVTRVVVGLPLNMDGSEGPMAMAAREFGRRVGAHLSVPVEMFDERLTSREAEERAGPRSRHKRRKRPLDAIAASVILEGWLAAKAALR